MDGIRCWHHDELAEISKVCKSEQVYKLEMVEMVSRMTYFAAM